MMKWKWLLVLLMGLGCAAPLRSQSVEPEMQSVVRHRSNTRDHARFGLKAYYFADDLMMFDPLYGYFRDGDAADLMQSSSLGCALRIPLGRTWYLQGEAMLDISAPWDEVAEQQGFFQQAWYGWRHRESYYGVTTPLYLGVRWSPTRLFAVRGFAGPMLEFSFATVDGWSVSFQRDRYWIAGGIGLDLLRVFSFDLGYRYAMSGLEPLGMGQWFASAALLL